MNKTIRWIILIISVVVIHSIGYLTFLNMATGKPLLGVIPEILLYLIPAYFVTTILIELLLGKEPNRNIKRALIKAIVLLIFFILFGVVYWIFYHYLIFPNQLEHTVIGEKSYLIFLFLMIFCGIKFTNKLYAK